MKFYVRCVPPKSTSQMRKIVRFKDKATGQTKTALLQRQGRKSENLAGSEPKVQRSEILSVLNVP